MFSCSYLVFFPFSIISYTTQMYHINNTIVLRGASEENFRTKTFSQTSDSIKHKGITALFSVYKYRENEHCLGTFRNGHFCFLASLMLCFPLYHLYTLFFLCFPIMYSATFRMMSLGNRVNTELIQNL